MTDILNEIDNAKIESELVVLEALCETYEKAYTILENYSEDDTEGLASFMIIQEAADGEVKELSSKGKKKNIIIRMFDAIINFFKNICSMIAGFFKKAKVAVAERLKKLHKKSDDSCDKAQEAIDDANSSAGKKYKSAEDKVNDELDKKLKEEFVDEGSEKGKKGRKKTTIRVKEKKVLSRVMFTEWERFLEYSNDYIDKLSDVKNIDHTMIRGAVISRPTRSINPFRKGKIEFEKTQKLGADIVGDIATGFSVHKSRIKNVKLFTRVPRRIPTNEVAEHIEKLNKLLNDATNKSNKVSESFFKVTEFIKAGKDIQPSVASDKLMKQLSLMQKELSNISMICLHMINYLAQELNAYSVLLDIIEPILDEFEKKQKERKESNK